MYKTSVLDPCGFNTNPDSAFYLNADLDPDPGKPGNPSKNWIFTRKKGLFVNFGQISLLLERHINADPDPQNWEKP